MSSCIKQPSVIGQQLCLREDMNVMGSNVDLKNIALGIK